MNNLEVIHTLLILLVITVSVFTPDSIDIKKAIILITPVVVFTLVSLINYHAPNLVFFPQGLIIGIILFTFSIWLTDSQKLFTSIKEYTKNIQAVFLLGVKKFQDWDSILYVSFFVVYEEIIWRVFLVDVLSLYLPAIIAILIASILFLYSHPDQRNLSFQSLDLFIFGFALASIYYFTRNLSLVIFIHWIRNMFIILNSIGLRTTKERT